MKEKSLYNPGCVEKTLEIVGNKWTGLILRELSEGTRRFGQLQVALCGISPRTLSARLDELAAHGIITKEIFAEVPPRVEYSLTKKGRDLTPVLESMAEWGKKYHGRKASSIGSTG